MAQLPTLVVSARVRGRWSFRAAVYPLRLARWLVRHAGVEVEVRSGREVISRVFVRPELEVTVKT